MKWSKELSVKKWMVLVGVFTVMIGAFLLASQAYFSYTEVTEAANNCFDQGGLPTIEKSGFKMTYFDCEME
ncbi:hypothetical protein [Jeotgalibacillus proteolyticus]|uniref:Uncharacterized protein n=1 Tax=Jeotgalibacillus proteolyticus TaxID=2082395 RepID=A0A2S5GBP3_9BACL|nr:hypothetical protein [Jeotgalibacillus proteolyticus]PPA70430.1 hypothetical protein C4B60_12715 [Jeotgalibacillus proteolyticus]